VNERRDEDEKDNAETRTTQRLLGEDGEAGQSWKSMFMDDLTATRDALVKSFLM
jgi:hypothetical protein